METWIMQQAWKKKNTKHLWNNKNGAGNHEDSRMVFQGLNRIRTHPAQRVGMSHAKERTKQGILSQGASRFFMVHTAMEVCQNGNPI
mmetsp:Transcript_20338/g.49858  ORF Transcript_20338/g.49858 Transcript_20338/m.49858 type:complete len:87 (+) Transcript_20338:2657-2917(+)